MSGLPVAVKYLITFLVSMVPIVELRGAIPIAESLKLNIFLYYPIAIIGNLLPVPVIYLFARKVLEWGKDKKIIGGFFTWCIEKGDKGGKKSRRPQETEEYSGRSLYSSEFRSREPALGRVLLPQAF